MNIPVKKIKCGKVYMITDTHFGARGNSIEWLNIMMDYFENQFIPYCEQNVGPDDILIHLGDVFDNRQSLNLQVLTKSVDLFDRLNKIFKEIHIIAGNHDVMRKYSNDISSLDTLKFIPNVFIYKEPQILQTSTKSILLLPWNNSYKELKQTIIESESELVCCHTNLIGCKFDRFRKIENHEGLDINNLNLERVYSGHIHWSQQNSKVNLLGTPYEITRSDSNNKKGFWILDPETMEETQILNNYSPKYKRLYLKDCLEMTPKSLLNIIENSRLDLIVPVSNNWNLQKLESLLRPYCFSINIIQWDGQSKDDEVLNRDLNQGLNFKDFLNNLVDAQIKSSKVKDKMLTKFDMLYKKYS